MGQYLHKFNTESAFSAAYNGSDYREPWVSYTDETQGQEHVDYNHQPINFPEFWASLGMTGTTPNKILFNYGDREPGMGENGETRHWDTNNPLNLSSWSEIDNCISSGTYKVLNTNEIKENELFEYANGGRYFYFLWELTENGWPEGFDPYGAEYGGYNSYNEEYFAYFTTDFKCLKMNGVWYGTGIYGD